MYKIWPVISTTATEVDKACVTAPENAVAPGLRQNGMKTFMNAQLNADSWPTDYSVSSRHNFRYASIRAHPVGENQCHYFANNTTKSSTCISIRNIAAHCFGKTVAAANWPVTKTGIKTPQGIGKVMATAVIQNYRKEFYWDT